jgi:hypothetical protein
VQCQGVGYATYPADGKYFQQLFETRVRNEHKVLHTALERTETDSRQTGIAASTVQTALTRSSAVQVATKTVRAISFV